MSTDSEHDPTGKPIGEEASPGKTESARPTSPAPGSAAAHPAAAPKTDAPSTTGKDELVTGAETPRTNSAVTPERERPSTRDEPEKPHVNEVITSATAPTGTSRERRATSSTRESERLKEEHAAERRRSQTELLIARGKNRRLTDLGLLIIRLLPILLLLRGIRKVQNFGAFRDQVAQTSIGQVAPDVITVLQLAAEVALPVALLLGLLARLSGLLLAVSMGTVFVLMHVMKGDLITQQGALNGEAAAVFTLTGLALFLTGAGRFSLDHLLWRRRAQARAERRAEKLTA